MSRYQRRGGSHGVPGGKLDATPRSVEGQEPRFARASTVQVSSSNSMSVRLEATPMAPSPSVQRSDLHSASSLAMKAPRKPRS
jgi:hypothetical protein